MKVPERVHSKLYGISGKLLRYNTRVKAGTNFHKAAARSILVPRASRPRATFIGHGIHGTEVQENSQ